MKTEGAPAWCFLFMSYIQLVQPNFSTVGRVGYCLEYARKCFGAAAVEPNAWTAWNNTKFRLNDTPQGVSYLNWYSYFENGVNLGHVTITTPQGIYSSPWQSGTDHAVLPSIAEVERIYGVKYVGSSGDISNVQVIKEQDMAVITTEAVVALSLGTQGTQPQSPDEYAQWVGKSDQQSLDDMITHYSAKGQARQAALEQQIAALEAAPVPAPVPAPAPDPNSVTVTQTGLWAAFKKFLGLS